MFKKFKIMFVVAVASCGSLRAMEAPKVKYMFINRFGVDLNVTISYPNDKSMKPYTVTVKDSSNPKVKADYPIIEVESNKNYTISAAGTGWVQGKTRVMTSKDLDAVWNEIDKLPEYETRGLTFYNLTRARVYIRWKLQAIPQSKKAGNGQPEANVNYPWELFPGIAGDQDVLKAVKSVDVLRIDNPETLIGGKISAENLALMMLGLQAGYTQKDVNIAYRKLSLQWHPDKHPKDKQKEAEIVFGMVSWARGILNTKFEPSE